MSRIAKTLADCRARGRKALIPFMTAGHPHPDATVPLMHTLVEAGVDIIELGVPFSDPMAEGPVIQLSNERALAHGMSLDKLLDMVRSFRAQNDTTPVVLMGYLNPIEVRGYRAFAKLAAEAGVDGIITVDMPVEEGSDYLEALIAEGLDPIQLVAPTTCGERLARICAAARGFIYYVSLKGVTGAAHLDVASVADKLAEIRTLTQLPLAVGFGIRDAASAAAIGGVADGVVVGSALVRLLEDNSSDPLAVRAAAREFIAGLRQALDQTAAAKA